MDSQIAELKKDLANAKNVVFLTGAGVSTPSGIPDYRSKGGIYSGQSNPEYLLSHENLVEHPASMYQFVMDNMLFPEAQPNIIHEKIAEITNEKGWLITQNVDGLDKKAGAQHVIEFHGNLYDLFCQKCGQNFDYKQYAKSYIHEADGGIIRPRITLYNEQIDSKKIQQSAETVYDADLIILVGTSFRVYPFAQLLNYRQGDAKLWVINREDIGTGSGINTIIADAAEVFAKI